MSHSTLVPVKYRTKSSLKLLGLTFWGRVQTVLFVEIAKNLSFLFADNIRSFIFGMIETMPPFSTGYYCNLSNARALCHHFSKNTWSNSP